VIRQQIRMRRLGETIQFVVDVPVPAHEPIDAARADRLQDECSMAASPPVKAHLEFEPADVRRRLASCRLYAELPFAPDRRETDMPPWLIGALEASHRAVGRLLDRELG
jgi:hypothetical protein